mmetsp:Transcript_2120/g.3276  ORF Transcript_2120/g.3276 Transcript_2120/m.3276 type:complete len:318 (+) Transcript_2120:38-991(+)
MDSISCAPISFLGLWKSGEDEEISKYYTARQRAAEREALKIALDLSLEDEVQKQEEDRYTSTFCEAGSEHRFEEFFKTAELTLANAVRWPLDDVPNSRKFISKREQKFLDKNEWILDLRIVDFLSSSETFWIQTLSAWAQELNFIVHVEQSQTQIGFSCGIVACHCYEKLTRAGEDFMHSPKSDEFAFCVAKETIHQGYQALGIDDNTICEKTSWQQEIWRANKTCFIYCDEIAKCYEQLYGNIIKNDFDSIVSFDRIFLIISNFYAQARDHNQSMATPKVLIVNSDDQRFTGTHWFTVAFSIKRRSSTFFWGGRAR